MPKLEIDEELVRTLASLLKETGLGEIEYEIDDARIRVAMPAAAAAPAAPAQAPAPAPSGGDAQPGDLSAHPGVVPSPMVGTAYAGPEPGKPAFVQVGDAVKEGDTVLIIEAMKVFNQIKSPRSGKVTQILFSDGQPVEFGEPLLIVE
jgi:acetyl-CoA carboxylase biotin carboxyl carrier protein